MKKLFIALVVLLSASGLFATEYKTTYEKKNVYKNIYIYMYEIYEGDSLVMYRIDTEQRPNYHKYIDCTLIGENKKDMMRLLSGLIDCYENDYFKYISNYPEIVFISDDFENDGLGKITERYCYQIK